jgi:DNA mismatch repair protein MutL
LGVPAGIEGLDPVKLLHELVNSALEKNGNVRADAHEAIMLTLATSVAIVYGQVLQNDEIEQLIGDLFLTSSPMLSPDGKTIATIIEQSNIDKLF